MKRQDFKRRGDYIWELPASFRDDMRVPARLYASDELLDATLGDKSLQQLANTATLPGVVQHALAMPDIHQGYGFPIGGVVATQLPDGVISPGGVGYDINCGVRLLETNLDGEELRPHLSDLATSLYQNCPSGVGKGGTLKLRNKDFDRLLHQGAKWAVKAGYARPEDVERTEEGGRLDAADAAVVSDRAWKRGIGQVGTLGAGNHFIEVDLIEEIYDEEAATATRSAPTTCAASRKPSISTASRCQTANWCARRSVRRKAKITMRPCASPPTTPSPTGRFLPTLSAAASRNPCAAK